MDYWDSYTIIELNAIREIFKAEFANLDLQRDILLGIIQDIDSTIDERRK